MTELPLPTLDNGERAAIALALSEKANLLLIDERAGVRAALANGLSVVGTVGVLEMAARLGMVDLSAAFTRLRATSFRIRQQVLDGSLASYEAERGPP
jgi:predicted nucleic acid-binding protein